jgi:hypothetical protein
VLLLGAAASTASISPLLTVVLVVVSIVAITFFLVRVLGVLADVVMAIKALRTNWGAADHFLRRGKGRREVAVLALARTVSVNAAGSGPKPEQSRSLFD